jgi:hypothetical protein
MILGVSIGLIAVVLLYLLLIRQRDLPYVEPPSPLAHLDERKVAIYENIRDANFEFLMGKLSESDYQQTKADLQRELNEVNREIAAISQPNPATKLAVTPAAKDPAYVGPGRPARTEVVCEHCGARFGRPMKFCGECGKAMGEFTA